MAQLPALPADLGALLKGRWQITEAGSKTSTTQCIRDSHQFFQIMHPSLICSQRLLMHSGKRTSLRYDCPGEGWGHTVVTMESPKLVRISTQGISEGVPFDMKIEARYQDACAIEGKRKG